MRSFSLALILLVVAIAVHAGGQDKKEPETAKKKLAKESSLLVLSPTGGQEVELADWKFTLGTRRFLLAKDAQPKPKSGSEFLEFREQKSTTYQSGILTLVPLASIRKIDYDRAKKTVAVVVLTAGDKEETLAGTTRFVGINKIVIEGDLLLGGGVATQKIRGGDDKGVRRITFPAPKAAAEVKGKESTIVAVDKEKTKHAIHDLQPLYKIDGSYRVLPYLMFKKTVKLDLDKIVSLQSVPSENKKVVAYDFEVTLKDGAQHTLTLLTKADGKKGKSATTFEGLIGRVPAGYKLFPAHTLQHVQIGEPKEKLDARLH